MTIRSGCMVAAIALLSLGAAQAQTVATGDNGMTLYTYDEDTAGISNCYDKCAENWPPYLARSGEEKGEGWTTVQRTDGTMQWAYDGKPVYYYVGDTKAGDATGDGNGGVWHVVTE